MLVCVNCTLPFMIVTPPPCEQQSAHEKSEHPIGGDGMFQKASTHSILSSVLVDVARVEGYVTTSDVDATTLSTRVQVSIPSGLKRFASVPERALGRRLMFEKPSAYILLSERGGRPTGVEHACQLGTPMGGHWSSCSLVRTP